MAALPRQSARARSPRHPLPRERRPRIRRRRLLRHRWRAPESVECRHWRIRRLRLLRHRICLRLHRHRPLRRQFRLGPSLRPWRSCCPTVRTGQMRLPRHQQMRWRAIHRHRPRLSRSRARRRRPTDLRCHHHHRRSKRDPGRCRRLRHRHRQRTVVRRALNVHHIPRSWLWRGIAAHLRLRPHPRPSGLIRTRTRGSLHFRHRRSRHSLLCRWLTGRRPPPRHTGFLRD